jgi:hypothetical protein
MDEENGRGGKTFAPSAKITRSSDGRSGALEQRRLALADADTECREAVAAAAAS